MCLQQDNTRRKAWNPPQGAISLIFTTRRKMGILQCIVNPFHKAYDELYAIHGHIAKAFLYTNNLRRVVNRKSTMCSD